MGASLGDSRRVLLFLGLSTLARLWLAAHLELAPDEAYYRAWAQRPAAGYFDHPPGIAWLIAAGTRLIGDSPLGVRFGAVLMGTATAWLTYRTSHRLFDDEARATDALLVALLVPVAVVGGVLATPDALLAFGWALTVWAWAGLERARGRAGSTLREGVWLGGGVGVACLAKHTGLLLGALVALLLVRDGRRQAGARSAGPWIGLLGAGVLVSPNLVWNLEHDWPSLRFQLGHGLASSPSGGLSALLELLAGQLVVVGPMLSWLCVRFWVREAGRSLWWLSAPVVLFFGLAALRTRGELNWMAPAYLAAIVAIPWRTLGSGVRAAALGGAGMMSLIVVVQAVAGVLPLPARADPTAQLHGWRELGVAVRAELERGAAVVVTERYQEAAELEAELDRNVRITALPGRGRFDQYDLWAPPRVPAGGDVLWLNRAGGGSAPPFSGFMRVEPPLEVRVGRAGQERRYHLYRLRGAQRAWTVRAGAGP